MCINNGCIFTKFSSFSHKVYFIINTLFPPLLQTLCVGRVKLSAAASEIFRHAVFQLVVVVRKRASSECILRGSKRWKSKGAKLGLGRMRENRLLHCCSCLRCAVWCCHVGGGLDSSSCLATPFKFIILTFLSLLTPF